MLKKTKVTKPKGRRDGNGRWGNGYGKWDNGNGSLS